jgi:hypothetical protein
MTKAEIRKAIKREFFTRVCEEYPGTVIDHSEGGRYCIDIPNEGQYEFDNPSGWQICTYSIPWVDPSLAQDAYHKKCLATEAYLQGILDNIVEVYKA